MTHVLITRRKLLQWGAAICCLALVPRSWGRVVAKNDIEQKIARRVAGLFEHPDSAREIGREYLKLVPSDSDLAVLVRKMIPDAGRMKFLSTAGKKSLRRYIASSSREDFRQGRMVCVNGWMLSQTELRLCAIVGLA